MTSTTHHRVTHDNGTELGWAFGPLARTGRFSLSTPSGLDLVRDAGSLAEAREALEAHAEWVRSR